MKSEPAVTHSSAVAHFVRRRNFLHLSSASAVGAIGYAGRAFFKQSAT